MGAPLYDLLSGRVPFERDDTAALVYAVVAKQPPPFQDVAKVPSEVAQLVHRLLAKARKTVTKVPMVYCTTCRRAQSTSKTCTRGPWCWALRTVPNALP